ncbi:MAG: phenazine biosynthesis protein [Lachnospiraceae bacterium]|jgi:hypothetical protein|nr:phenazine biosynthesis protein [Lachnospiraceae bacterium]
MTDKQENAKIAKLIVSSPFWRAEYFPEYFTESFTMINLASPPGMPNFFDFWESERCIEWLNRTVKSWESDVEEFYTTPDPEIFWAIGKCGGDVRWGGHDGSYHSQFICRIEMKDGKINHIKGMIEPIRMLKAAGLEVKPIHKGLEDPRVDEWLEAHPEGRKNPDNKIAADPNQGKQDLDMSPEAIAKRREINTKENLCGVEREKYRKTTTVGEKNGQAGVWFVPDDLPWDENPNEPAMMGYDGREIKSFETKVRMHGWMKSSSPWAYRDTRGKVFETDDKNVLFIEMLSHGPARWLGNGYDYGHYHQAYFMIIKLDDAGRIIQRTEVLNPIYKYASVNVTLPSFPYYC